MAVSSRSTRTVGLTIARFGGFDTPPTSTTLTLTATSEEVAVHVDGDRRLGDAGLADREVQQAGVVVPGPRFDPEIGDGT